MIRRIAVLTLLITSLHVFAQNAKPKPAPAPTKATMTLDEIDCMTPLEGPPKTYAECKGAKAAKAKPLFQIPTGSGGGPKPNLACSDDRQPSGFTGCEELRLHDYQQQLNQLQQIMAPIEKKAQEFIDAVVASHPGEQYVTAQMQPGQQAQQQFTQQFPLGAVRPKPVAAPPAAPKGLATPPQIPTPATAPKPSTPTPAATTPPVK